MGALRIGGRHVGSTDDGDMNLHACWRSGRERKLLGCDGCEPPLAADEAARRRRRLVTYDSATGETSVVERVVRYLTGKITPEQLSEVAQILNGEEIEGTERPTQEMAEDARRREMFPNFARIGHDLTPRPLPPPRHSTMSVASGASFNERFPNAGRLK